MSHFMNRPPSGVPSGVAPLVIPQLTPINRDLESFASLARQPSYIYSPVIMNTVLTMMVLNNAHGNLLLPVSVPYGGYQLTYNGTDEIFESTEDERENIKVNTAIIEYIIKNKGDARFVIMQICYYLNITLKQVNIKYVCFIMNLMEQLGLACFQILLIFKKDY